MCGWAGSHLALLLWGHAGLPSQVGCILSLLGGLWDMAGLWREGLWLGREAGGMASLWVVWL